MVTHCERCGTNRRTTALRSRDPGHFIKTVKDTGIIASKSNGDDGVLKLFSGSGSTRDGGKQRGCDSQLGPREEHDEMCK
jgi:hypothetical protein